MQNKALKIQEASQNNQSSTPKYPETLEEQRDYYLNLFEKWKKWQKESPEKLPVGFRIKEEFDFEKVLLANNPKSESENFEFYGMKYADFIVLSENDNNLEETFLYKIKFTESHSNHNIGNFSLTKKIVFHKLFSLFTFINVSGVLNIKIINLEKKTSTIGSQGRIEFLNCNFSHITLENFDRGYFSPQTNEYLNQMENEGKLTLINCTFSGLPIVRESFNPTQHRNQKIFEFTKLIKSEHRSAFAQYLSGFVNFLEETQDKHISLDISLNGGLIFKASSDNQDDLENIEKYLLQYMAIPLLISHGQRLSIETATGINPSNAQTILIALESDVHNLETKMKLKNAKLMSSQEMTNEFEDILLKMNQKIYGLNIEIKQINYKNELLLDENLELLKKIKTIKEELRTLRLREITTDNRLDILIGLVDKISVAGDKQDKNLLNKGALELKSFYKKNLTWLHLISIVADGKPAFNNLKEAVESIINFFK
jgi:hypothetical protein